jgi:hypothetical protein
MNLEVVAYVASRVSSSIVIGAYAVAARGFLRFTRDFDLMTTDRTALLDETWSDLRSRGFEVSVRKGDFEDPLAGVVRIKGPETEIDLVVAKHKWEQAVIDRAEPLQLDTISLPVPRTSDLILLKLSAGGPVDLMDAHRLLDVGDRKALVAEVTATAESVPQELRDAWQRFLSESSSPGSR